MKEMTAQDAHDAWQRGEVNLVDVREAHEYAATHVADMPFLPMSELAGRVDELPVGRPLVVMCRSGARSAKVAEFLNGEGRDHEAINLSGGIIAWASAGLPYDGDTPA